jgi:hypothetical protein
MFLVPILIDEKHEHVRVFLLLYLKLELEILVMKIMLVSTTPRTRMQLIHRCLKYGLQDEYFKINTAKMDM